MAYVNSVYINCVKWIYVSLFTLCKLSLSKLSKLGLQCGWTREHVHVNLVYLTHVNWVYINYVNLIIYVYIESTQSN